MYNKCLADNSNKTMNQWKMLIHAHGEVWLNSEQMIEWGMADDLIIGGDREEDVDQD